MIQKCALPECGKEFNNWRSSCCCISHRGKYAARLKNNTLHLPPKTKDDIIVYHRIKAIERQIKLKRATPPWANMEAIKKIYEEARRMELDTGIKHEVDHVIPIRGKLVSGLHVETNMQVLTKSKNREKGNSF